ncbi:MAG TPA: SDR family oxidoreductase [Steroidobacteraceae bacterium]|nr:SDR family oxidoreductase [Steroidobacteraceae bacterium]
MPTVLVTGASRGIGLELVRQYCADGWSVLACCRHPERAQVLRELASARGPLRVHALDVSDFAAVDALARELHGQAIDVLINNAGLYGPKPGAQHDPRQEFGHMDYAHWQRLFVVNTQAPYKMAEAFIEHVAASEQRKIVAISTGLASIGDASGGFYAYRTTKAALNMAMVALSRDLAARRVRVCLLSPGWVRTDMGGPNATLSVQDSVRGLRARIAELDDERSGQFVSHSGERRPW